MIPSLGHAWLGVIFAPHTGLVHVVGIFLPVSIAWYELPWNVQLYRRFSTHHVLPGVILTIKDVEV
jgi:hypothetical protein